ncbi:hypothetical protein ACFL54_04910 [Planctomycetota bacterium]
MISNIQNRGMVLLVVLGVLALMSVLAITFVQMTRLEKAISQNYVDHTRAVLVAESGVEYAIARIRQFQGGALRPDEIEALQYQENPAQPGLEFALKPSFQLQSPDDKFSGIVSSTYGRASDAFKLKVVDESGKLNLNDTDGAWNPDTDPNPDDPATDPDLAVAPGRLRSILENLGDLLFDSPTGNDISNTLFDAREKLPAGRFSSMSEVQELLVPDVLDLNEFKEFSKHVTVWSWQDRTTIRPNFQLSISDPDPGYSYPQRGFDVYVFRDFQNSGFELEPRAPVNVNTATPELLQVLLTGISGWFMREGPGETMSSSRYGNYGNAPVTFTRADEEVHGAQASSQWPELYFDFGKNNILGMARQSPEIIDPEGLAQALWERIHDSANPNPIETWEELDYCLRNEEDPGHPGEPWARQYVVPDNDYADYFDDDAEGRGELLSDPPGSVPGGFDHFQYDANSERKNWWLDYMFNIQIDALMANFNPNSQINDYTPNKTIYRRIDKSHLTKYTTEFCFEPTGTYIIQSLGLILNPDGQVLAKSEISTVVELYFMLRHSTQAQFMGNIANATDLNCLNGGPFKESEVLPTAGAGEFCNNGFTIQSYPEPLRAPRQPDVPEFYFSPYDGSLMLATWQEDKTGDGGVFHHHFNGSVYPTTSYCRDGLDDLYSKHNPGSDEDILATERNIVTESILTNKNSDPWYPGNLYPDGAYSEAGRTLTFRNLNVGSDGGLKGSVEFWIKPNFMPAITSRVHKFVSFWKELRAGGNEHVGEFTLYYFTHAQTLNRLPVNPGALWGDKWTPTRSLVVGWGGYYPMGGGPRGHNVSGGYTPTAVHDFPEHDSGDPCEEIINLEGHCWNHIGVRWDASFDDDLVPNLVTNGDGPYLVSILHDSLNEVRIHDQEGYNQYVRLGEVTGGVPVDPWQAIQDFIDGLITLDELMAIWNTDIAVARQNYSSDSVYDDVIAYEDHIGAPLNGSVMQAEYYRGRYINIEPVDAFYTSPEIDLFKELKLMSKDQLSLRSVSWTLWWPKYNREENGNRLVANFPGLDVNADLDEAPYPKDPMGGIWNNGDPATVDWDPISIDFSIIPAGGDSYWSFRDSLGDLEVAKRYMPSYAGGSKVRNGLESAALSPALAAIERGDQFRYRIYFNFDDSAGIPFYESPVLDDITFVFSTGKAKILSWKVLHE